MPSHLPADHPASPPAGHGAVDALIAQLRRLRGGVDAIRREALTQDTAGPADETARVRWQRALCELAAHQLDDLGTQLGQLREGLPAALRERDAPAAPEPPAEEPSLIGRVGSAEWNLRSDRTDWSDELYEIFGRSPADGPLSLDELPAAISPGDQTRLTAMVTECLVDGKTIDGEFGVVRPDGSRRTVHIVGEPVLDADGGTASMWAVWRDVSDLRRTQQAVSETRDSIQRQRRIARAEHRLAVELQEAVLPPWRGTLRFPLGSAAGARPEGGLDLAAHYLPATASGLVGGDWYDTLELPDGATLLSVGDLAGHGVTATSGMAMLVGAVRGMALTGAAPGPLLGWLNQLLEAAAVPALGSALCCRYDPRERTLCWAQAGHPPPLLVRDGTARTLDPPPGVLLGATDRTVYAEAREQLRTGDVLVLHTDGLAARDPGAAGTGERLRALAGRIGSVGSAHDGVRALVEEFGGRREDDACVLVARVTA